MRLRRWIRWILFGLGIAAIALLALFIVAAVYVLPRVSSKSDAPYSHATPQRRSGDAAPILQLESHTCGLLSLTAAYNVYGLAPDDKNLRFRLGVDRMAHPFDSTSTGTLHPDLLRVLAQDRFEFDLIDPGSDEGVARLASHLDGGDVAMMLIARRANGRLHWILADSRDGDHIRIVDSLAAQPYDEPTEEFVRGFVLSIIAIRPTDVDPGDLSGIHAAGIGEMNLVRRRLAERGG